MKPIVRLQRIDSVLLSAISSRPSAIVKSNHVSARSLAPSAIITSRHIPARSLRTSATKEQHATLSPGLPAGSPSISSTSPTTAPLSVLPLQQVLRSWLITSVSSSPALLAASTRLLHAMLNSRTALLRLDGNPVLRSALWHTFYAQFCAGETRGQVAAGAAALRAQGYSGLILEYALEVLKDAEGDEARDVAVWRAGMLESVDVAAPGDFVGLKWSGMGAAAMRLMGRDEPPSPSMAEAMHAVCAAAAAKDVSLLPAAEETWTLDGFNTWTLGLQARYNRSGRCVVYNTYQAYLKRTAASLARHLEVAREQGYTLGIKLVRGAYLGSEERSQIWPTIEATHRSYDTLAAALLRRTSDDTLAPAAWPELRVVLATHNMASVETAQALRREQAARGDELVPLAFAQLQGMADEVSCALIAAAREAETGRDPQAVRERVFKCTTWGPMHECLNYLLRRAAENKDAAGRTHSTRDAMRAEVWRRVKATFKLA